MYEEAKAAIEHDILKKDGLQLVRGSFGIAQGEATIEAPDGRVCAIGCYLVGRGGPDTLVANPVTLLIKSEEGVASVLLGVPWEWVAGVVGGFDDPGPDALKELSGVWADGHVFGQYLASKYLVGVFQPEDEETR